MPRVHAAVDEREVGAGGKACAGGALAATAAGRLEMPPSWERRRRILEIDHGDDAEHVRARGLRHGEGAVELLVAVGRSTVGDEIRQAVPALRAVDPGEVEPALRPRLRRNERRHRERGPGGERGPSCCGRNASRRPPGGGAPRRIRSMERMTCEWSQVTFVVARPRPPRPPAHPSYPTPTGKTRGGHPVGNRLADTVSLSFSGYR